LGASWEPRGASCGDVGASWGDLGASWGPRGTSWDDLGASWESRGASWGGPGSLLRQLGRLLGSSGSLLGRLGCLLGASWGLLGRLGRDLGASWGDLRISGGSREVSLARPKGVRGRTWGVPWGLRGALVVVYTYYRGFEGVSAASGRFVALNREGSRRRKFCKVLPVDGGRWP
jgi:hypothetical protein